MDGVCTAAGGAHLPWAFIKVGVLVKVLPPWLSVTFRQEVQLYNTQSLGNNDS